LEAGAGLVAGSGQNRVETLVQLPLVANRPEIGLRAGFVFTFGGRQNRPPINLQRQVLVQ